MWESKRNLFSLASASYKSLLLSMLPFLEYMRNDKKKGNASRGKDCSIHIVIFIVLLKTQFIFMAHIEVIYHLAQ